MSTWTGPAASLTTRRTSEEFGYPKLTAKQEEEILSRYGARLYGIDREQAREIREQNNPSGMGEAHASASRGSRLGSRGKLTAFPPWRLR